MKIQHLRFKNLNSLEGEWQIDFTAPEYESEGIFVITGPTGVGKTTILDAFSLALYGRTPRLDRINASSNDIMSRQTGECFAEVIFSTTHGSFRCHWSQRRARSKANAKLQSPKHEISSINEKGEGTLLESMLSKVGKKVEDVCGMDFDRFTRSVMLAQGNFAKFLQSSADDRSPILEQITGTAIYSEISKLVHLRKSEEDSRLKEHLAQMSGIQTLDEETLLSLNTEIKELNPQLKTQDSRLATQRAAEQWIVGLAKEQQTIEQTEKDQTAHLKELTEFLPQKNQLAKAEKAHEIEPDYVELTTLKKANHRHQTDIEKLKIEITRQTKTADTAKLAAQSAETTATEAKQNHTETQPKLIEARKLETENQGLQKQMDDLTGQWKDHDQKQTSIQSRIDQAESTRKKIDSQEAESLAFLNTHTACVTLATEYAGIVQQVKQWKESTTRQTTATTQVEKRNTQITQIESDLTKTQTQLTTSNKQLATNTSALDTEQQKLAKLQGDESIGSLEKQLNLFEDKLRLEEKIVSLEKERARLDHDTPCPLCGSTTHPFADHTPPPPTATEHAIANHKKKIQLIRTLEKSIQSLELKLEKTSSNVTQAKNKVAHVEKLLRQENQSLQEETSALTKISDKTTEEQQELATSLSAFLSDTTTKVDTLSLDTIDSTLARLHKLQQKWKQHSEVVDGVNDQKIQLTSTLDHERKTLNEVSQSKDAVKATGAKLRLQLTEKQQAIHHLIGDTTITKLSESLSQALLDAEATYKNHNQLREDASTKLKQINARHAEISKQEQNTADLIQSQQTKLLGLITTKGFVDLNAFLSARLEEATRTQLKKSQQQLEDRKKELTTRLLDAQQRLKIELKKQLTTKSLDEVRETIASLTESRTTIAKQLGALQEKLKENESARSRIAEKLVEKENLEKELARWVKLHGLIGSADGKKFRNFAQGLTFEIMVRHANAQLGKMSDRYQLIRDSDAPLDLNVIDSYQAGEIRSTKNLSGGESFIISLALALGLSQMASKKVRVDSLFLDEGFGTLDEDALETALETLSSLNREGKLIGIISHISALKERIPTQLNLSPTQQGKATITGPGVSTEKSEATD